MSTSNNWNGRSFAVCLVIYISTSIVIVTTALDISFSVGEDVFSSPSLSSPLSSSSAATSVANVDGIRCDTIEFTKFHIHAHLDIFVNGKPFIVPSQIGIDPEGQCLYWLHTHDDSGIIHIESPTEREFTVGNLIEIWEKTLGKTKLFDGDLNDNANSNVSAYVNGVTVPSNTDFRNIGLKAHDEIALVFGPIQGDKIPSEYQFQEGL